MRLPNPLAWLVRRFDERRLNHWLRLRQDGETNEAALKKAWLSSGRAYRLLDGMLRSNLGCAGLLIVDRGRFSAASNAEQTAALMCALAYLYPALDEATRAELRGRFQRWTGHNWGYVRRAASAALSTLEQEGQAPREPEPQPQP